MRPFDHDYAEEIIERLSGLSAETRPRWGRLTRDQLYAHLADTLRYSMGRIVGPLVLSGLLRIPKNLKIPGSGEMPRGNLETLQAVLEDYLNLVQADELAPVPHVYFGDLGVDGWARLHMAHFEHHLRQFGV